MDETFTDEKEVRQAAKKSIQVYIEQRLHWSLNFKIPAQVHDAA